MSPTLFMPPFDAPKSPPNCPEEKCKDTVTVHTGGVCPPDDVMCPQAMKAAGLEPPYGYTTMTLDTKCLAKLGLAVKAPMAVGGAVAGKYGPNMASKAAGAIGPRAASYVGMGATGLAEVSSGPLGVTFSLVGAAQFLVKECECKGGK